MRYVFYADVFWLNQFLLHTAILLLATQLHGPPCAARRWQEAHKEAPLARCQRRKAHGRKQAARCQRREAYGRKQAAHRQQRERHIGTQAVRCVGSSALGSTLGTLVLLLMQSYYAYLTAEYLAILPLMALLAFGRSDLRVFFTRFAGCFGTAILLGGLVTALENVAGIARIPFLSVLIAFLIAGKWIRSLLRHRQVHRLLAPVVLQHRGKTVHLTAFTDTGNLLREPYGGRAVHLLRASTLKESGITQDDFLGFVPYQALGSSEGLLELYRVDALGICACGDAPGIMADTKTNSIPWICPAVVAKAPDALFYGKEYNMILNSEITELQNMHITQAKQF